MEDLYYSSCADYVGQEKEYQMLKLYTIKLMDGSENLFYLAYGMPQSRTSRRAEGSAVYTARILWSHYEPDAIYDDRMLCNTTQNKQSGQGGSYDVDSLIYSQIQEQQLVQENNIHGNTSITQRKQALVEINNTIKIFPNPASTQVTVSYISENDGEIIVFNTLGEKILSTQLLHTNTKVLLSLLDVANGIYHYEIIFPNQAKVNGLLSIQK